MGGKGSTRWGYRGDYVPPLTIDEATEIRASRLFRQQPPELGRSVGGRLEGGFLWIASGRDGHRTKSGKGRWVPLTPKLRQTMRDHFAQFRFATYNGQRTPWVFHHTTTRRRAAAGDRVAVLRRAFEGAVSRAKLPSDLHQHDLRHRRVTTWLAAAPSSRLVMSFSAVSKCFCIPWAQCTGGLTISDKAWGRQSHPEGTP